MREEEPPWRVSASALAGERTGHMHSRKEIASGYFRDTQTGVMVNIPAICTHEAPSLVSKKIGKYGRSYTRDEQTLGTCLVLQRY